MSTTVEFTGRVTRVTAHEDPAWSGDVAIVHDEPTNQDIFIMTTKQGGLLETAYVTNKIVNGIASPAEEVPLVLSNYYGSAMLYRSNAITMQDSLNPR